MSNHLSGDHPESPKFEPEILPPGASDGLNWSSRGFKGMHVYRVGPLGLFFWVAGFLVLLALVLFAFAGALLILAPLVAAIVVGSIVVAWFRRFFQSGR